jgi:hypothetical protein
MGDEEIDGGGREGSGEQARKGQRDERERKSLGGSTCRSICSAASHEGIRLVAPMSSSVPIDGSIITFGKAVLTMELPRRHASSLSGNRLAPRSIMMGRQTTRYMVLQVPYCGYLSFPWGSECGAPASDRSSGRMTRTWRACRSILRTCTLPPPPPPSSGRSTCTVVRVVHGGRDPQLLDGSESVAFATSA